MARTRVTEVKVEEVVEPMVMQGIRIKDADRFHDRLICSGMYDSVRWTASKCHPDPHIQWAIGLPNHNLGRDKVEDLCNHIRRHLLRSAGIIQELLPVLPEPEIGRVRRART